MWEFYRDIINNILYDILFLQGSIEALYRR